jgi:hypothetical protein
MLPRTLNNAVQERLKEWGILRTDVPTLLPLIEQYLNCDLAQDLFSARLKQVFRRQTTKIPRKAARGGHEHVPTPDVQMDWLLEDILAIVEAAKSGHERT